ncbi:MAG: serine/threonine protein kinase [Anaerolineae bacterium]|nr:serine/threonine protein kinase [Anaerolineae bacterium]
MTEEFQGSLLGREIDGYQIEILLGEGGMARVYRGRDVRLNRHVAIKVIQPSARTDAAYMARFEKEARAIAQLDHPNIVKIYRFGDVGGLYYMAMQYIEGADLGWILENYAADNEFIPHDEVLRIITEVCHALDYAHSQGVIHRDVKPSNIILNQKGQAFLTDFGLALLQAEGTRGEIFGSPYYIAPEQAISSAGAVPQSDIYALGVVLYQILTGSVPFDEGSAMDIAMAHMTDAPPPPLMRNPQLHPAFTPVLDMALRKEPAARYQTGAALAAALARAMTISTQPSHVERLSTTRFSSLSVPDKVSEFRKNNPLPPLPIAAPPTTQAEVTSFNLPSPPTIPVGSPKVTGARHWGLLAAASIGVIVCLVVLGSLLFRGPDEQMAPVPTETEIHITVTSAPVVPPTRDTVGVSTPWLPSPTALVLVPSAAAPIQEQSMVPILIPTVGASSQVGEPTSAAGTMPIVFELRLVRNREDSLFVINQTADGGFPLEPLQLGDGRRTIHGSEWGVAILDTGACVTAWKDGGNPQPPAVTCTLVGERIVRRGPERFWKDSYNVYYAGVLVGTCTSDDCTVSIVSE